MKKMLIMAALALLISGEVQAQRRVLLPLTGWQYPNAIPSGNFKNPWNSTTGDTLTNTTADSLIVGVLGAGKLAPLAVTFTVEAAEISGTADSVDVTVQVGNGGFYVSTGLAFRFGGATSTTKVFGTRTMVLNNTGTPPTNLSLLSNTAVIPHCDAIRFLVANKSGTTATTAWRIRVSGIYEQ